MAYTEQTNKGSMRATRVNAVETNFTATTFRPEQSASNRGSSGKAFICFRCGKPGHIQRNCAGSQKQKRRIGGHFRTQL